MGDASEAPDLSVMEDMLRRMMATQLLSVIESVEGNTQ